MNIATATAKIDPLMTSARTRRRSFSCVPLSTIEDCRNSCMYGVIEVPMSAIRSTK